MDFASTHGVPTDSTSTASLSGSVTLYQFGDFRTVHPPLVQQLKRLETIARRMSNVLLLGESGTGKELLAHAVHQKNPRRGHPFIPINCAAIPAELMESELFGYVPGAFTGAATRKPGKLELAHEGTLFLDEIADLPLSLQPKLLRVLETHQVEPLGSVQPVPTDFRLVCYLEQHNQRRLCCSCCLGRLLDSKNNQFPDQTSSQEGISVCAGYIRSLWCA